MARSRIIGVWLLVLLMCCLLPADERVELDRQVGALESSGWTVTVHEGQAAVRSLDAARVELWAQAPDLTVRVSHANGPAPLRVDVLNCAAGSVLTTETGTLMPMAVDGRRASCRYELPATADATLRIAPKDADAPEPFTFAVLSDVQRGIGKVQTIFERMNSDPDLRFVVSTGDLTNLGERQELVRVQKELEGLDIPLYSTVGNHEMGAAPQHWHELFGRFNVHFRFKGAVFSLIDSGNATVDPQVYEWLESWLEEAKADVHVVLTHLPPLDPVGLRGGGFRHRKEGAKLMQRLAAGRTDVLFLGHIHSYYSFSIAGVPAYISGGGGAIEERLDGLQRHYLRVRVKPGVRIESVGLVRVD